MIGRLRSSPSGETGGRSVGHSAGDLLRAGRPAMGTKFEVVVGANVPGASDLACRALDRIDQLESQLTVYREDSELSFLNANAHLEPIEVEPGLLKLLVRAFAIGSKMAGAYDVTSGALSEAWGFTFGPKRVPDPVILADARSRTGMHHVRLDQESGTVSFDRSGVMINLGSIGKGHAIDEAAAILRKHWWPTSALVHGGHSSVYALGSPPTTLAGRWTISLRNPFDPDRPLGSFRLKDRGLGTSGAAFQQFEEGGRLYGHILDPRTGEPAMEGPASVSVLAPTAADADALSTGFYLIGLDATMEYLAQKPEIGAIFVLEEPETRCRRLVTVNVPEQEFSPDLIGLIPVKIDSGRRLRIYQINSTNPSRSNA